jgi:hypothetical protein
MEPHVGILGKDGRRLTQAVLGAGVLAALREVRRGHHQRSALLDVFPGDPGEQGRAEGHGDEDHRQNQPLPEHQVGEQERAPVEDEPDRTEADEQGQADGEDRERSCGSATERPSCALADVVDEAREVAQPECEDRPDDGYRDRQRDPGSQRRQHGDPRFAHREEGGDRGRHGLQGVQNPAMAGEEGQLRPDRVRVPRVQPQRGPIRPLGPAGLAEPFGAHAQEHGGAREVGKPLHADLASRFRHLIERP